MSRISSVLGTDLLSWRGPTLFWLRGNLSPPRDSLVLKSQEVSGDYVCLLHGHTDYGSSITRFFDHLRKVSDSNTRRIEDSLRLFLGGSVGISRYGVLAEDNRSTRYD